MRKTAYLLCLLVMLALAAPPAQAQLRQDVRSQNASTRLMDSGASTFSLNKLFSPDHFRMSHSYEMSMGSFGGQTSSMGMYTNTMQWQFSQKLAARVDLAFAHSLFGNNNFGTSSKLGLGQQRNGQFFLRNAELAYRPSENVQLHFSIRQSPYGSFMSPYGYYSPYSGYGAYSVVGVGSRNGDDLFFRGSGR